MLDDSLPIRNDMIAARRHWTIVLVSLPESFVLASIVVSFANSILAWAPPGCSRLACASAERVPR
jgi:hypothetical protein